ncbi:dephospho-CoA kinase [Desulfosarcina cetonica]|uniref:dephospho-CoA kinase n=1 Tax=Desulfosarcina cetonica TaxID=90730 RepID=UPI0006CF83B8|nr:dephospho-CoA kinase [Desulfosarcina cetonica]
MIIAGLTGGIASGKSTVSRIFRDAGAIIIDADKIARDVVRIGAPAYREIVRVFGDTVLLPDGTINRKYLGDIIFNAPAKKARLDAIVHPHVYQEIQTQIGHATKTAPDAVVILDIPLLFETRTEIPLAEVILVYVPEALQVERLIRRDEIDAPAAMARIHAQMPIEKKRRLATVIIDNSGDLEETRRQTLAVFKRLDRRREDRGVSV